MNSHLKYKIPIHLRILAKSKSLEHYCNNCGSCCKPGVNIKSLNRETRVLVKSLSCKFLKSDVDQSSCSVYDNRFEKASWCVPLEEMIEKGLAPKSCPYVETLSGYSPTLDLEKSSYDTLVPLLKLGISSGSREPYDHNQLSKFLDS